MIGNLSGSRPEHPLLGRHEAGPHEGKEPTMNDTTQRPTDNPVRMSNGPMLPAKDVGITYLIWLFFGTFGGHKFYLGKPGMGVAYLLTLGFLWIGVIIDLFTIPRQVRAINAERGYFQG